MKNLNLWNAVEKTNPKYTTGINPFGKKITAISAQYQIKKATEQFGVYGESWGFNSIEFDYSLSNIGLVVLKAVFFFPNGEFPISNSIKLYIDAAQTKVDDNFAKKIETDTLTKALSKLGFNADVFMGKFDDLRYVDEMKNEFAPVKNRLPALPPAKYSDVAKFISDGIMNDGEIVDDGKRWDVISVKYTISKACKKAIDGMIKQAVE